MSLKDALKNVNEPLPEVETLDDAIQETLPVEEAVVEEAVVEDTTAEETESVEAEVVEETSVTTYAPPPPPVVAKKKPLEILADRKMEEIRQLNPDFNMDYMNVFTRLKIDTKGRFSYELAGETFSLSDDIAVRLLAGDYMHQRWGNKEDGEREGELICYSTNGQVSSFDGIPCSQCPYGQEKCKLRFAIGLNVLENGEDPDEIFNINMPTTGALAFADYVKLLTKKKLPIKEVITRMRTEEKDGKEKGQKFNAILFKLGQ